MKIITYICCYKHVKIMDFIKMYHIFKNDNGVIWKIETVLIPKEHVEHWRSKKVFVLEEDLKELNINVL